MNVRLIRVPTGDVSPRRTDQLIVIATMDIKGQFCDGNVNYFT